MQSGFKKFTNLPLIGLWLFLPAVLTVPILAFWTFALITTIRVEPFSLVLVLLAALQILIIASYQRQQKSFKTILRILLFGWVIQVLSIAIAWSMTVGLQFEALSFLFWIPLAIIGSQVIAGIVYSVFQIVGKKLHPSFFRHSNFPLIGVLGLLVCILAITNIYAVTSQKQAQIAQNRKDSNFDISDIAFRTGEKNTQLGRLSRPLRIFHTLTGYIGVAFSGEQTPLPFLDAIGADKIDQLFLDVFNDKAYFVRGGAGYIYDLAAKTTVTFPASVQATLQEQFPDTFGTAHGRRIIAAHKSFIALADTELAGTGDVAIYDINSGEKVFQTIYLGYDQNRLILFWINGKGYRLILNASAKPTARVDSTIGNTMSIYLDENTEAYHRLSENEIMYGIGKIVFSGNADWFYKDKTPIYKFQTAYPDEKYGKSKFSIRDMYLLGDERIAIEVEKNLIVINLMDKSTQVVNDQNVIKQLLDTAKLLSADDENAHHFLNQCGDDMYTQALSKEKDTAFAFCLK